MNRRKRRRALRSACRALERNGNVHSRERYSDLVERWREVIADAIAARLEHVMHEAESGAEHCLPILERGPSQSEAWVEVLKGRVYDERVDYVCVAFINIRQGVEERIQVGMYLNRI